MEAHRQGVGSPNLATGILGDRASAPVNVSGTGARQRSATYLLPLNGQQTITNKTHLLPSLLGRPGAVPQSPSRAPRAILAGRPRRRPGRHGLTPFRLAATALAGDFLSLTPSFARPSRTAFSSFAIITRCALMTPDTMSCVVDGSFEVGQEVQISFPRRQP